MELTNCISSLYVNNKIVKRLTPGRIYYSAVVLGCTMYHRGFYLPGHLFQINKLFN